MRGFNLLSLLCICLRYVSSKETIFQEYLNSTLEYFANSSITIIHDDQEGEGYELKNLDRIYGPLKIYQHSGLKDILKETTKRNWSKWIYPYVNLMLHFQNGSVNTMRQIMVQSVFRCPLGIGKLAMGKSGQKWATNVAAHRAKVGKSGQKSKWGILILKNYERTTRKQNAAKFYVLFYSFLYQQENILLLIQLSNRLWCCLTLFKLLNLK